MAGKQRVFLLVLLLFGLPAVVTLAFLRSNTRAEVADGAQPGGTVRGVVRTEDGKPAAGVGVTAFALQAAAKGEQLAATQSGTDGAFELVLPPTKGRYALQFSGSELQDQVLEFGWLDASGKPVPREPLAIEMRAGCRLDFELVRADKLPAGAGRFELTGQVASGFFSGWNAAGLVRNGSFENGVFTVDGLPPMRARVLVLLATGDRVDAVLELAPGKNRHRVEL